MTMNWTSETTKMMQTTAPILDPRFPCPWREKWQPPTGHPEPDPQVQIDSHLNPFIC
jgi:hypothetical protein